MIMLNPRLRLAATDFKNLLLDRINNADTQISVSELARAVGVDPSSMSRYINSPVSHLPTYLVPFLTDDLRTAVLHYLDNKSDNPIKGHIDTSDLNGSVRDECDRIIECLGEIITLERTLPGARAIHQKTRVSQLMREYCLKAEQEISSRE